MNPKSLSIEDLSILPEEIKRQLIGYAEFLLQKYASELEELSPKLRVLLEDRSVKRQIQKVQFHDAEQGEDEIN